MARRVPVQRLAEHTNVEEILGILAQVAHIRDDELRRLAAGWRNTVAVADARRRALSPDSPLVVEVLAAFDALAALYAEDLDGVPDVATVPADVASTALKAVRDAIAAAYARPILRRSEHAALSAPWRAVYPRPPRLEPDLGPQAEEIRRLLGMLPMLAGRCHEPAGRRVYDVLLVGAMTLDEEAHDAAVETAYRAAVLSGRRRVWTLVRRSAAEGFGRVCSSCRRHEDSRYDDERVLALCADAAGALVVGDVLDPVLLARLTEPVRTLATAGPAALD